MKYIFAMIIALLLSACATDPATVKTLVDAQQAANSRPTLALKCPAGGCEFEYTDPRDRQTLKMPTNGWDAVTSLGNNITSLVPIIVTGRIATAGFDALRNSGGTQTTTTVGPVTNTGPVSTTGATTTLSGTGTLGSGAYSTSASTASTDNHATVSPAPVVITPVVQMVPTVINQPVVVPPVVVNPPVISQGAAL